MRTGAESGSRHHLGTSSFGLVFAGGAVGVFARELLTIALPNWPALPTAVFVANMVGALLLGYLLEALTTREPTVTTHRLRLLLGTGLLGGFTTYSAVAYTVALLAGQGQLGLAVVYGLATVCGGALCTWCGVSVAASITTRRRGGDADG